MKIKVYNQKPKHIWVDEGKVVSTVINDKLIIINKKSFDITVENSLFKIKNNCSTIDEAKKKVINMFTQFST